jgi:pimeloyl-ACP methyl ester carboxylesterase
VNQPPDIRWLEQDDGPPIAYRLREGSSTLVFLPGYASDMEGAKAVALDEFAGRRGLSMLRFDYSGTGASEGRFENGTLGRWLRSPSRVEALVGIAAAPDFTEWGYTDEQKTTLETDRRLELPNPYAHEPQVTTLGFWQSGQELQLLGGAIDIDCPVRLIHGDCDEEVPLEVAFRLMERLRSDDVQLTILKGGGHRLSKPLEIDTILRTVATLVEPSQ